MGNLFFSDTEKGQNHQGPNSEIKEKKKLRNEQIITDNCYCFLLDIWIHLYYNKKLAVSAKICSFVFRGGARGVTNCRTATASY